MNDKELDLNMFENADNDSIRRIAENCPASDEEKERIFAMSRRIYEKRTTEDRRINNIEVSGVEGYKKPVWHKLAAMAAALVLTGGAVAGALFLNKMPSPINNNDSSSQQMEGTEPTSKEIQKNCPFGDITCEVARLTDSAAFPTVYDLKMETVNEIADYFNTGSWTVVLDGSKPEGEYKTMFVYNNGIPFKLDVYSNGGVVYENSSTKMYYKGDEIVESAAITLSSYSTTGVNKIVLAEPYDDLINKVWDDMREILTTASTSAIPANSQTTPVNTVTSVQAVAAAPVSEATQGTASDPPAVPETTAALQTPAVDLSNSDLISKAQSFYLSAIDTDRNLGAFASKTFNINTSNTDAYVTSPDGRTGAPVYGITLDELRRMYHMTFSDRYSANDDTINNHYFEHNGQLYWILGDAGIELYLARNEVTAVQRQDGDEIFFTVERYYDDIHNVDGGTFSPYTIQDTFSVIVQPDGSWKVGKFNNPLPH